MGEILGVVVGAILWPWLWSLPFRKSHGTRAVWIGFAFAAPIAAIVGTATGHTTGAICMIALMFLLTVIRT